MPRGGAVSYERGTPVIVVVGRGKRRRTASMPDEGRADNNLIDAVLSIARMHRVSGFGFRIPGFDFQVPGLGFRLSVSGFRVSGFGCRVPDIGCRGN